MPGYCTRAVACNSWNYSHISLQTSEATIAYVYIKARLNDFIYCREDYTSLL